MTITKEYMTQPIIVGIDVSEDRSIAVRLTYEDRNTYPISQAKEFYDVCDFHEIQPHSKESLKKLVELGDIYCFEPTGNYSKYLYDTLLEAGKEIRIAPNNIVIAYRQNCKWNYSDDEHDAVVLAYYCHSNLNDLGSFNRVRIPELETCYQLILSKERINDRIRNSINQARNLLHYECPTIRKIKSSGEDNITMMWTWIAGREMNKKTRTLYENRAIKEEAGTYYKTGKFTEELITLAASIDDMQNERARIRRIIEGIIKDKKFNKYRQCFNMLQFGVYDQAILLCQIYPFEQFIDADGSEKRQTYKRKRTQNGNTTTKRIGLKKFINMCGRGLSKELSGQNQDFYISRANAISKLTLMQWAKRTIVREKTGGGTLNKGIIVKKLSEKYWEEANPAYAQLKGLMAMEEETLKNIDKIVNDSPENKFFKELIKEAIEGKKSPSKILRDKGTEKKLKNWLASRAIDRAIKILFKIMLTTWKGEEVKPEILFKPETKTESQTKT
jgi:hypothetical protein